MITLYGYFRSSATYRARIALNLKGLAYETVPVHLLRDGGEQGLDAYRRLNPQELVPTLVDDGAVIRQSVAIAEYLDERYPDPPFLPAGPAARAGVRALALAIACDIHPLTNLRVLQYLSGPLGRSSEERDRWYRHWVETGLAQVEAMLPPAAEAGRAVHRFAFGDRPGLADILIAPQIANARRMQCDLSLCPGLVAIDAACQNLVAFRMAAPAAQIDAE